MKITKPKDGDYRYVTKFLIFPKRFDGAWYWLETITFRQIYLYHGTIPGWSDICVSNPLTGLPIDLCGSGKLLDTPMTKIGKYYE